MMTFYAKAVLFPLLRTPGHIRILLVAKVGWFIFVQRFKIEEVVPNDNRLYFLLGVKFNDFGQ